MQVAMTSHVFKWTGCAVVRDIKKKARDFWGKSMWNPVVTLTELRQSSSSLSTVSVGSSGPSCERLMGVVIVTVPRTSLQQQQEEQITNWVWTSLIRKHWIMKEQEWEGTRAGFTSHINQELFITGRFRFAVTWQLDNRW